MSTCSPNNPGYMLSLKAAQLRSLADDVEHVADTPAATARRDGWTCPNATAVREALDGQRKVARSCAGQLRALAAQADRASARAYKEAEEAARKQPAGR